MRSLALSRSHSHTTLLTLTLAAAVPIAACHRAGGAAPEEPGPDSQPVSVGYGTQPRGEVTGAVSSLTAEEIHRIQGQDMERLLEGRIPGLQVIRRGGDVALSIRGGGTPHVVVDGAAVSVADLLALPPEIVQRIDVRKDGGAAVYGFRSAHGVIEVTTWRGRR